MNDPDWSRLGAGLSCYTANLAAYFAGEFGDAGRWLAESIRLAVRTDLPDGELAFSHHAYPLYQMPDGTRLRYAAAPDADRATAGLAAELDRRGRVLVVVDNSRLPWSPATGTGQAAPHWLLVVGRDGQHWQVLDAFSGLLPPGEQRPYAGRLPADVLLGAMGPPPRWTRDQRRRNSLAFGLPVPVPRGATWQWLYRSPAGSANTGSANPGELPGTWLTSDHDVLPFLAGQVAEGAERGSRYLDDLWSAAGHRVFKYRWLAVQPGLTEPERERFAAAEAAWDRLPVALRFAVESARRGQPRASLVATMFEHLRDIEYAIAAAPIAGWPS